MTIQPRQELEKLSDYVPGKSIDEICERHGLSSAIKLASNENPWGASPKAKAAFLKQVDSLHLYPRGDAPTLLKKLAEHYQVDSKQIILGNGSDEVIDLIGKAFIAPGDFCVSATPTFSVYEFTTLEAGGIFKAFPVGVGKANVQELAKVAASARVLFLCNPNNPTGKVMGEKQAELFTNVSHDIKTPLTSIVNYVALLKGIQLQDERVQRYLNILEEKSSESEILELLRLLPKNVLLFLDEAYAEFAMATDYPNLVSRIHEFPNLFINRTFSKIYGLAGLRLGYGISSIEVIRNLWKVKPPFDVNLAAQAAGIAALQDKEFVQMTREKNREGMVILKKAFEECALEVLDSEGNFLCAKIGQNAKELVAFMESRGMIVRGLSNFGLPEWIRVTVGKPEENAYFIKLLKEWCANG